MSCVVVHIVIHNSLKGGILLPKQIHQTIKIPLLQQIHHIHVQIQRLIPVPILLPRHHNTTR